MLMGTFVNALAVIGGGLLGLILHQKFPQKIKMIAFQGMGMATMLMGIQMALKVNNILLLIFSLILGGIFGEWIDLEKRFQNLGDWIKAKMKIDHSHFTEGWITTTLLFCVGPMAILGALDEGLRSNPTIFYAKSALDGLSSIAFAATYGAGVLLSALPILIYQGGLTLFAAQFQNIFSQVIIDQLTAVGGILLMGIAFKFLEIKNIRVSNLLPALLVVVILTALFA